MLPDDDEVVLICPHCGADTAIDTASMALANEVPVVDCTICCRPCRVVGTGDDLRLQGDD